MSRSPGRPSSRPSCLAASRRRPGWAAAATVLVLAGCGTSAAQHSARYAGELRGVESRFTAGTAEVLRAVTPRAPRSAATRAVGHYEAVLIGVESHLRRLRPPPVVARLHRRLLRGIVAYGSRLRIELSALRSDAPATLTTSARRFTVATEALAAKVRSTVATVQQRLPRAS